MKKLKNIHHKIQYNLAEDSWGKDEKRLLIDHIKKIKNLHTVKMLESLKKFSEYLGSKYSVMVNSGGSANLLSILALFF